MDAKKIALLIIALILAGGTAFMARNVFKETPVPVVAAIVPAKPEGPQILVATHALPVGTIIAPDAFRFQPWPEELIENAYFLKGATDPNSMNGTVVRSAVTAGQPITKGDLVKPGDRGFLAAALGPGMRAITVPVSALSGVAGFIFPGDRVDMMLTQTVTGTDATSKVLKTTETIVRNVRVLATDQRTTQQDAEGKSTPVTSSNVTLEVTPRIAEKISVAQTVGQISLSLRSIADNTADLEQAIANGTIKVPAGNDPKAEKQMLLAVASQPSDTKTSFVTGGDVSRFQTRSVPKDTVAPVVIPDGPKIRITRGSGIASEVSVGNK